MTPAGNSFMHCKTLPMFMMITKILRLLIYSVELIWIWCGNITLNWLKYTILLLRESATSSGYIMSKTTFSIHSVLLCSASQKEIT